MLVFPELPLATALLIGAILAPTDAALGLPVITNPAVPIRIRRILNVESGLNDGIATPFVLLFIALATADAGSEGGHSSRRSLRSRSPRSSGSRSVASAAACSSWPTVAAWRPGCLVRSPCWPSPGRLLRVGGVGRQRVRRGLRRRAGLRGRDPSRGGAGGALQRGRPGSSCRSSVWTVFGATFVSSLVQATEDLRPILYAILSLTVIRMVPVAIALIGSRLGLPTVAFIGWFGPRGLASIVFGLLAVDALTQIGRGLRRARQHRHLDRAAVGRAPRRHGRGARRPVRPVDRDAPGDHGRARCPSSRNGELRPSARSTWIRREDAAAPDPE